MSYEYYSGSGEFDGVSGEINVASEDYTALIATMSILIVISVGVIAYPVYKLLCAKETAVPNVQVFSSPSSV